MFKLQVVAVAALMDALLSAVIVQLLVLNRQALL